MQNMVDKGEIGESQVTAYSKKPSRALTVVTVLLPNMRCRCAILNE